MSNLISFQYGPFGAGGSSGYSIYRFVPWELKHITSFTETVQGSSSTIGIPNRPASKAQTFDMTGAYRTISISGIRLDNEEYISNVDFIYNELNLIKTVRSGYYTIYYYSVGLSWLISNLQVAKPGYKLIIEQSTCDKTLVDGTVGSSTSEIITVGQGSLQYTFSGSTPGMLSYSLTLTEKRSTGSNIYKPTNPYPTS